MWGPMEWGDAWLSSSVAAMSLIGYTSTGQHDIIAVWSPSQLRYNLLKAPLFPHESWKFLPSQNVLVMGRLREKPTTSSDSSIRCRVSILSPHSSNKPMPAAVYLTIPGHWDIPEIHGFCLISGRFLLTADSEDFDMGSVCAVLQYV